MMVGALGAAGVVVSGCSSSGEAPLIGGFAAAECQGSLVEIARFPQTGTPAAAVALGAANNLALEGDTLYMAYAFATTDSGLPPSGGIVAIPLAGVGGGTVAGNAVAAADPAKTSQWYMDDFWVSGGQIYLQSGTQIMSVPAAPSTPSTLAVAIYDAKSAAFAHDADFGYSALVTVDGLTVTKTPAAGGAPTVLATDPASSAPSWLGGMTDAGDAVLLQAAWPSSSGAASRVWSIPKDGTPRSEPRPDVHWSNPLDSGTWLAWDGTDIFGPTMVQYYIIQSRVAPAGTSAPVQTKFYGKVATRRNDEILSFQTQNIQQVPEPSSYLLVASSKGAPAGTAVACGSAYVGVVPATPAGIAANDGGIYVSYWVDSDTVIARVTP
jgi:hypothetical protein